MHNEEINKARGFIYNILSLLFVEEYTKEQYSVIKQNLEVLQQNAFDEDVAKSVEKILIYLKDKEENELYQNYQDLFMVPFGTYVSLSSSLYHEQREAGFMLVKVRDTLAKTKIRKDEKLFTAPEDHYGFIFTLSTYLIKQQLEEDDKQELHKELFTNVINPHIDQLIYALKDSENPIYAPVGDILDNFMQFERVYLNIPK